MALPFEQEHVAYLQYVERWSLGEEPGPKLSKPEWRKRRKKGDSDAAKDLNGDGESEGPNVDLR